MKIAGAHAPLASCVSDMLPAVPGEVTALPTPKWCPGTRYAGSRKRLAAAEEGTVPQFFGTSPTHRRGSRDAEEALVLARHFDRVENRGRALAPDGGGDPVVDYGGRSGFDYNGGKFADFFDWGSWGSCGPGDDFLGTEPG